VLAIAAAPASATSIQTLNGQPYTGQLTAAIHAGTQAVFTTADGTISCNGSIGTGSITNTGSLGSPVFGNLSAIDWKGAFGANENCTDTIAAADHLDFNALGLPWSGATNWVSNQTTGAFNAEDTYSGVSVNATFSTGGPTLSCNFGGDFNNSGGGANQVQGLLFNPDNTASNRLELRFAGAHFDLLLSSAGCPAAGADLTAVYILTGQGGADLQVREAPPAQPPGEPPAQPPASPPAPTLTAQATGQRAAALKKCKKKRTAKARKKCRKKANALPV
jgi:hypothetical protein